MKTKNKKDNSKDPVKVYCRLRPPKSLTELLSVKRYSDNVIQLYHPLGLKPEAYYNFKYVFPQEATQKEVFDEIAYPLVEDLLNGKDGLLFTYGITSSGKTFTLTGKCQSPGILPRTLDVIFNTIKDRQARKFVFKPDGQNYFEIRSTADAIIDWQKEKQAQQKLLNFASRAPSRKKNNNNDDYKDWDTRVKDDSVVELPEDNKNAFSVFISYVEIYNNYIYDLLDDTVIDQIKLKQPQSKLLREDIRKKVFVLNGVEHEVKSSDEATELFIKGIKRRKIAHTTLNAESSRSHSVFNIKIVQAPKDAEEEVVLDSKYMTVSQLSLVDLAGSERANRTKNAGDRLKEASSINNSLMALRNCIDILRENQKFNQNKLVSYREYKLTHLFKSYFEGLGSIKMIICVNPSFDDFDETIHVMKFAEATQEVMVKRAQNIQFDFINLNNFNVDYPTTEFNDINDDKIFPKWFDALDERKKNKELKLAMFKKKAFELRNSLILVDKNSMLDKQKVASLENDLKIRESQIKEIEKHVGNQQSSIDNHLKQINELEVTIKDLKNELNKVKSDCQQKDLKLKSIQASYKEKYKQETQALKLAFKRKLKNILDDLDYKECLQREKKQMVLDILEAESLSIFKDIRDSICPNEVNENLNVVKNDKKTPTHQSRFETVRNIFEPNIKSDTKIKIPVINPRHKRSLSSGNEKWIDHRPLGTINLGTVMTPKIKNGKSISNLRNLSTKDLINSSKYALTHHVALDDGDIETQIYKGDVIPTSVGGAQIMFNDIETLHQKSPHKKMKNV